MGAMHDDRDALRLFLRDGKPPEPQGPEAARCLMATLQQQGLVGLVSLRSWFAPWPEIALEVQAAQRGALFASVQVLDCAARVMALLEARALRALPLKGCAVAEWLYDSPAERAMADADILALDDWRASAAALQGAGFTPITAADHAAGYREASSGVIVELHRSPTSCPDLFPFDRDAVGARGSVRSGQVKRIPAPEDLLVQLALHAAFQHGLVLKLGQYLDFRRLIERAHPDPALTWEIARSMRAERALAVALEAARIVVGVPPGPLGDLGAAVLDRGIMRFLRESVRTPLQLVHPSRPRLARVRWELARGQRVRFVRASLLAQQVAGPRPARARILAILRRTARMARRTLPGR